MSKQRLPVSPMRINYPNKLTSEQEAVLNDGALPWTQEAVDAVCGEGQYKRIKDDMEARIPVLDDSSISTNTVIIDITHTQQINAVCEAKGESIQRLKCYGFVMIDRSGNVLVKKDGLYHNELTVSLAALPAPAYATPSTASEEPGDVEREEAPAKHIASASYS